MSDVNMNIPIVSPTNFVTLAKKLYLSNIPYKLPSIMIWGQPGVGKSACLKQLRRELEEAFQTNYNRLVEKVGGKDAFEQKVQQSNSEIARYVCPKRVNLIDLRLLLFTPVEIKGVPVASEDRQFTDWLLPRIFNLESGNDVINILMLDEITACSPSVQATAYQITLDRQIGEFKIPDNTIIICAGNRVTDKSVAYKMPKALCNRLSHYQFEITTNAWLEWAIHNGIHETVTYFIGQHPQELNSFNPKDDNVAFATPRTWEMCSNYMHALGLCDEAFLSIKATVGIGLGTTFQTAIKLYKEIPTINELASGTYTKRHNSPSTQYAIASRIIAHLPNYLKNKDYAKLENILAYSVDCMELEQASYIAKTLMNIPNASVAFVNSAKLREFQLKYSKMSSEASGR